MGWRCGGWFEEKRRGRRGVILVGRVLGVTTGGAAV